MGLLGDLTAEIVRDFTGLKDNLVDELSGDADEILLRRFKKNYDKIPTEAIEAIAANLGPRGQKVIADKEFEMANEEFYA